MRFALASLVCMLAFSAVAAEPPRAVVVTVIGTADLHGHLERLPLLAGYVDAVRALRKKDGGVLLVDSGDMFQGTLESNQVEGDVIVGAYKAMGYAAAAVGNHEFDFGPEGPDAVPRKPGDDPRGALKKRAAEASFPFLVANVLDAATGKRVDWPNMPASTLVEVAGVKIGLVGVTTESTPGSTIAANFRGLAVAPLADTLVAEAKGLRARGARVVVALAHAGGRCEKMDDPRDLSSCKPGEEVFDLARALPSGVVDLIVAGHTHAPIAHFVNGIPVIESYYGGRAFGRVDIKVPAAGPLSVDVFPPRDLCPSAAPCGGGTYEGMEVAANAGIERIIAPAVERARALKEESLGVAAVSPIKRSYDEESALGNLFTDLMRKAVPAADVAVTNGGGLRADLPAGPLTYGTLYEAMPFDNQLVSVHLAARDLSRVLARNLQTKGGILLVSGVGVTASCGPDGLDVTLERDGHPIPADQKLTVVTNDFLATGGDGAFGILSLPASAFEVHEGLLVRDAMADVLRHEKGTLDPQALYPHEAPRLRYKGSRPISCAAGGDLPAAAR
jgi:2',3'-cyclic-nucleotide 2'-phosphodiesterase (5'-nucleotidase family)